MTFPDFNDLPNPGACVYPQWATLLQVKLFELGCGSSSFRVVGCAVAEADFFAEFPDGCEDFPAIVIRDCTPAEIWYWNPNTAAWVEINVAAAGSMSSFPVAAGFINEVSPLYAYGNRAMVSYQNIALADATYGTYNGTRWTAVQAGRYRFSAGYSTRIIGTGIYPPGPNSVITHQIELHRNGSTYDHRDRINLSNRESVFGGANTVMVVNLGYGYTASPGMSLSLLLPGNSVAGVSAFDWRSIGCVADTTVHLEIGDYVEATVLATKQDMGGTLSWGIGGYGQRKYEYFIVEKIG